MRQARGSGDIRLKKSQNGLGWRVEFTRQAEKELRKLGSVNQDRVRAFLRKSLEGSSDPRLTGKALGGTLSEFWRYRVGDIRILCRLEDHRVIVVVVSVRNRREVYR
jgi:mRNA interferase RelE/StbE